jgi:hypothetical protein
MVNHKKDKILQIFKRMEILRPRDLVAIGISGSYLNVLASTQHVHAGYDVDFARNKSCSDDLGQSTSPGSGCLSFAPSAEFSDTKVLNVVTRSTAAKLFSHSHVALLIGVTHHLNQKRQNEQTHRHEEN